MRSTFRRWLIASLIVPLSLVFTVGQAFAYSYNGGAAASYADTYWSNYNSSYPSFSDDCTNFVSQSLYAGGLPEYVFYNTHTGAPETTSNNVFWFMDPSNINYAYSWTVAADLYAHLTQYGYGTLYATHSGDNKSLLMTGMVKGDVLFYNWGRLAIRQVLPESIMRRSKRDTAPHQMGTLMRTTSIPIPLTTITYCGL